MPELTGEVLADHKNMGDISLRMAFIPLNICSSFYRPLGLNWFNDFIIKAHLCTMRKGCLSDWKQARFVKEHLYTEKKEHEFSHTEGDTTKSTVNPHLPSWVILGTGVNNLYSKQFYGRLTM